MRFNFPRFRFVFREYYFDLVLFKNKFDILFSRCLIDVFFNFFKNFDVQLFLLIVENNQGSLSLEIPMKTGQFTIFH